MSVEIILTFVFLITLLVLFLNKKPKNFPPGPFSWPIVGNLPQLGRTPYKTLLKMRDTYGDVIGIQFGARRAVFINDAKLVKEAFNLNSMSGRPLLKHMLHPESKQKRGVIFTEGNTWVEQRRFILKNLRDFGFGKKSMESLIQEEVGDLVDILLTTVGKPIDTHLSFNVSVVNALWTIVSGARLPHNDPKITKLIDLLAANVSRTSVKVMRLAGPFPWLVEIAPGFSGHREFVENRQPVFEFIQESIKSHQSTRQEGTNRDLIDCYLEEMSKTSEMASFNKKAGEENVLLSIYDLFLAGAETTSTTLTWLCFLLSHHPECQAKLSKIIEEAIGTRAPCLTDRPNIPYLEAVILEVLRYSALVPLGVSHTAMDDVNFHGFNIPKGTMVMANQFGILHDPKVWGDPEIFRPERFLSSDEKTVLRHEALIPFSVGKRVCLGESLARDELFLFTAGLMQRFKVEFDPAEPNPEITHPPAHSVVLSPTPHKIVFSDRY